MGHFLVAPVTDSELRDFLPINEILPGKAEILLHIEIFKKETEWWGQPG